MTIQPYHPVSMMNQLSKTIGRSLSAPARTLLIGSICLLTGCGSGGNGEHDASSAAGDLSASAVVSADADAAAVIVSPDGQRAPDAAGLPRWDPPVVNSIFVADGSQRFNWGNGTVELTCTRITVGGTPRVEIVTQGVAATARFTVGGQPTVISEFESITFPTAAQFASPANGDRGGMQPEARGFIAQYRSGSNPENAWEILISPSYQLLHINSGELGTEVFNLNCLPR